MKTIAILISALVLAGCASIPVKPYYGPLGPEGGYSSMRRSIEKWAVRYTGNEKTTGSTVRDLTLLRSADIAEEAGYSWFTILEKVDESAHITETTSFSGPVTAQKSTGWSGGVDTLTGSQSADTRFISQYLYEIACSQEKPTLGDVYNAEEVSEQMRTRYSIPELGAGAVVGKAVNP